MPNHYIHWMNFIFKKPLNHTKFYAFWKLLGFREWQNCFPEVKKLTFFIYKVHFTLHPLVALMHNTTTAKEHTNWSTPGKKKMGKKVEDFFVFALLLFGIIFILLLLTQIRLLSMRTWLTSSPLVLHLTTKIAGMPLTVVWPARC